MAYHPPRERDAWFVIRGFVYQVQLTIERWLQLGPNERLELERGEDIDVVGKWTASAESTERLLEQVKHRDSNITLNSAEARAALANFVEHTEHNPGQLLTFRFVTNAAAGTERQPPFPKRWSGIEMWEELRQDRHEGIAKRRRIAALRSLLRRGNRPSDTPQDTWNKYLHFLKGAGCREIDALVKHFEWSIGHENAVDLRPTLEQRIALRAESDGLEKHAYDRLFSHVFEALSDRGTKALTREDIGVVLRGVAYDDGRALKRLTQATEELKERVDLAMKRLDAHDDSLDAMQTQMVTLARTNGLTGRFQSDDPVPSLTTPPRPASIALRKQSVESAMKGLVSKKWVALTGTSGSGKSEIARQTSEEFEGRVYWLSLRDLDEHQACTRLVAALLHVNGAEPGEGDWREQVLRCLKGALVVLDDLPRFDVDSQLGRTLLPLAGALRSQDVSLITTSPFELSGRAQRLSLAHLMSVPAFDESETRALLVAFGAPDTPNLDAWARLVAATTAGHAELVVTAAAHLRRQAWNFSEERLLELLSRTSEEELRTDVLRRVSATTSDQSERELLCRLALISGAFGIEDLRLVALVEQPVSYPDAALASLEGLWIQPQAAGRFAVCPLARRLGEQLDPKVRRGVHSALGLSFMRRESLGPIEVLTAITHFISSEEFDRAGLAYLLALSSVKLKRLPAFDAGLFSLWSDTRLPERMSLGIRIHIRTLQVGINEALGKNIDTLVDDLLALTDCVNDSDVSLLAPVALHLPAVLRRDFDGGSRAITRIVASLKSLRNPLGEPFDKKLIDGLQNFLWHQTVAARTPAAVRACLQSFTAIPQDVLQASAKGDAYEMGVVGLCDGVWLSQFELPEEERDWDSAWSLLDEIAQVGAGLHLNLLVTAARRTQIIIASEVRKDLNSALKIAKDTPTVGSDVETFLVEECIGRQLVYSGRYTDAIDHLENALRLDCEAFGSYRFYAQLSLANAYSRTDPERALRATLEALAIARRTKLFPRLELVKALGEVAIATHHGLGPRDAFRYIEEAARLLFRVRSESAEWRDVHVLLAHTSGYLQSLATTGRPPPGQTVAGEEFAEPRTGIFLTQHDKRPSLYSKESEVAFRLSLALFANALDDDTALNFWATSVTWGEGASAMDSFAIMFRTVYLIGEEQFADAITLTESIQTPNIGILHLGLALSAKIAGIALEEPRRAQAVAREVADRLTRCAEARADSKTWLQLGRVLEIALDPDVPATEVSQVQEEPGTDAPISLCALLLTSARQGEQFGTVLSAHVGTSMRLLEQKQVFMPLHRHLLLPTITRFWLAFTARSRFLLRGPDLVSCELNAAIDLPPSLRAQAILRTVIRGLGVQVPDQIRTWVDQI